MAEHAMEQYDGFEDREPEDVELEPGKPVSYSKGIVILMFVTIILFTVACMYFYWCGKTVDPVLILGFFACFGFEFGSLAFIHTRKLKYKPGDPANKRMPHVEIREEEGDE